MKRHFEWVAFLGAITLMALLDPYTNSTSWCLFDLVGLDFCPGEGLGHSIAFFFRGEFNASLEANLMGPIAVIVLSGRIITVWIDLYNNYKLDLLEKNNG